MGRAAAKTVVAGVVTALAIGVITASANYAWRFAQSDPPPLEGKAQASDATAALGTKIDQVTQDLKADNLERRLEAAWSMVCAAKHSHSLSAAQGFELQLSKLQEAHLRLLGRSYPLTDCP